MVYFEIKTEIVFKLKVDLSNNLIRNKKCDTIYDFDIKKLNYLFENISKFI